MIADLKPYPEYKESGLQWLGRVPAHWEVERAKSIFQSIDLRSKTGNEELLTVSSARGVVPRNTATVTMFKAESYLGYKLCWPDDLVINSLWAWGGGLGVSSHHGIISSAYGVYRIRPTARMTPAFVHQLVRSSPFNWELHVRSKGIWISRLQLTDESFLDTPMHIPPYSEQAAIVRFIDHADRRIRRYIGVKQKLIKLLEEQKQAIIYRAVTRGLDPNVRLKPSAVEWLGEVPEHWEVRRLGRVARVFNGTTPSRFEPAYWLQGTVPWLSSGKVNDYVVETASELVTQRALRECSISLVPRGAVIIGLVGQGKTRGKSAILGIDACINQNLAAIIPRRGLRSDYLHHFLTAFYKTLREYGRGGNQEALNCAIVSNFRVSIPPPDEQKTICDALGPALAGVQTAERRINHEISLLREYRTRLIADVVTGKFDVREAAARLPDEPDDDDALDEVAASEDDEPTPDHDEPLEVVDAQS